jgi:protein gp37
LFALIDETPWLDWQLLTKRPENVRKMWPVARRYPDPSPMGGARAATRPDYFRQNVWIGTSISDQATADKYVPELLKLRDLSPLLFVSAEPLLGPVRLDQVQCEGLVEIDALRGRHGLKRPLQGKSPAVDWVIGGGESGPKARPCDVAWIRSVVQQCRDSDVPVFVKQMGAVSYEKTLDDIGEWKYAAFPLEDHKGGDPDEWPEDLRVREFPALIGGGE